MRRQKRIIPAIGLARCLLYVTSAIAAGLMLGGNCVPPTGQRPAANTGPVATTNPTVTLHTNLGKIVVELFPQQAPLAVADLLAAVDDETYLDDTIFHNAQATGTTAGSYNRDLEPLEVRAYINESNNGLKNTRGRVALYGPTDTEEGLWEILFSTATNANLDFDLIAGEKVAYTVIGQVIEGLDVLDAIMELETSSETTTDGETLDNVPQTEDGFAIRIIQVVSGTADDLVNTDPVADAGPDQFADPGQQVQLDGLASSDPDGDPYLGSWALTDESLEKLNAAGFEIELDNPAAGQPTFTAPEPTEPIDIVFELTIIDDRGGTGTDAVNVNLGSTVNEAPTAEAGLNRTVAAGSPVTLDGTGSTDADGTITAYAWEVSADSQTALENAGLSIAFDDATAAQPTFTAPQPTEPLTVEFVLTVTDNRNKTGTDTVQITISSEQNLPPTADAGNDQTVAAGAIVTLDGSGSSDAEGDPYTFAWTLTQASKDAIAGLNRTVELDNPAAIQPTFTAPAPPNEDIALTFELTVSDASGRTSTDSVVVTVQANQVPAASAGADQTVVAESQVTLDGSQTADPEGDPYSFAWQLTQASQSALQTAGLVIQLDDTRAIQPKFTAPDVAQDLTVTFELTVTDHFGRTSTDTVDVAIVRNLPPTASAGDDQAAGFGDTVQLQGSGTDTDGTVATYAWSQVSGETVTLSDTSITNPTFTAPAVSGVLTFRLTVTDDGGKTGTDDVDVAVYQTAPGDDEQARVRLQTTLGDIVLGLLTDTPVTTDNFLQYTKDGFYDGTIFHRVMPGFVVQGGGFLPDLSRQAGVRDPIVNEFDPSRSNVRETVAMAKVGGDPDSATSQFFFNLADNSGNLDNQNGGFTVFARVEEGMDVVDAIAAVPTSTQEDPDGVEFDDVPDTPVIVNSATVEWERP